MYKLFYKLFYFFLRVLNVGNVQPFSIKFHAAKMPITFWTALMRLELIGIFKVKTSFHF